MLSPELESPDTLSFSLAVLPQDSEIGDCCSGRSAELAQLWHRHRFSHLPMWLFRAMCLAQNLPIQGTPATLAPVPVCPDSGKALTAIQNRVAWRELARHPGRDLASNAWKNTAALCLTDWHRHPHVWPCILNSEKRRSFKQRASNSILSNVCRGMHSEKCCFFMTLRISKRKWERSSHLLNNHPPWSSWPGNSLSCPGVPFSQQVVELRRALRELVAAFRKERNLPHSSECPKQGPNCMPTPLWLQLSQPHVPCSPHEFSHKQSVSIGLPRHGSIRSQHALDAREP